MTESRSKKRRMSKQNTPGLGIEYEIYVPSYFALVLNGNKDVDDFSIRSNVESFGNLDDIIVNVKMVNGQQHNFAIQLKHKENNQKKLYPGNLEGRKEFGLEKYCKAFSNLQDDEKKYLFILYTNANFDPNKKAEVKIFDMVKSAFSLGTKLFNTSSNQESVYKFGVNHKTPDGQDVTKEDYKQFFRQFFLYTSQKNFNELRDEILAFLEFKEVSLKYIDFFRKWHQGLFVDKIINKKTLNLHLMDMFLSSLIVKNYQLSDGHSKNLKLFENAVREFDVTVISAEETDFKNEMMELQESTCFDYLADDGVKKQLQNRINNYKIDFVKDFEVNPTETIDKCLLYLAKINKFVGRTAQTLEEEIKLKILYYLFQKPLIVDFSETSAYLVYKMMELYQQKEEFKIRFVFVGLGIDVKKFSHLHIFKNLDILSKTNPDLYKNILKISKVSLPGRRGTTLKRINQSIGDITKFTEPIHLHQMLKGNFLIGEEKENLPSHYVPRSVCTTTIDFGTILVYASEKFGQIIIDFNGIEKNLDLIQKTKVEMVELSIYLREMKPFSQPTIVSADEVCSVEEFEKIRQNVNKDVHYLRAIGDDNFILVKSTRKTRIFRKSNPNLKKTSICEDRIQDCFKNPVNILTAQAGMGKSTLLKYLKNEYPTDWWPIKIDLKSYNTFLKKAQDGEAVLRYFVEVTAQFEDSFSKKLKEFYVKKKKVVLFLDGLDEIEIEAVDNTLKHVNQLSSAGYRIWLSSRQNLQTKLENSLNVSVIEIDELGEEQQKDFVNNRLKSKYQKQEIEEIIDNIFDNATIVNNSQILGVPLQLNIITQIFLDDRSHYRSMRESVFVLTKMYEFFFEGRYKYSIERMEVKSPHLNVGGLDDQIEKYEFAALHSLLDQDDFERLNLNSTKNQNFLAKIKDNKDPMGIIVTINSENRAVFEHITYAEYFAALYLSENFDKAKILRQHLFSERFQNLMIILNMLIAGENSLLLAVIYKDMIQYERYFNEDNATILDKAGRNLLQVTTLNCTKYSVLNHNHNSIEDSHLETFQGENLEVKTIINQILNLKINPFQRDQLFEWNSLEYALASRSLYMVEEILKKHGTPQFMAKVLSKHYDSINIAYYSLRFGYSNLLSLALAQTDFSVNQITCNFWPYSNGNSILHFITMGDDSTKERIFNTLIADYNPESQNRCTLCKWICGFFHQKKQREKINAATDFGFRLLHFAAVDGDMEIANLLLNKGAFINIKNDFGQTPLYLATREDHFALVSFLLFKGASINFDNPYYNDRDKYFLSLTSKRDDFVWVKKEPYKKYKTNRGNYEDRIKIIKLLLEKGYDIDRKNTKGETFLHNAIYNKNIEMVEFLLHQNANIHAMTNSGDTVLHYAVQNLNFDGRVMDLLKNIPQINLLLNVQNETGNTPLHMAVYWSNNRAVKMLLQQGANTTVVNSKQAIPLHLAVYEGQNLMVRDILEKTNDMGLFPVHNREYPLDFAVVNGKLQPELIQEATEEISKCTIRRKKELVKHLRNKFSTNPNW